MQWNHTDSARIKKIYSVQDVVRMKIILYKIAKGKMYGEYLQQIAVNTQAECCEEREELNNNLSSSDLVMLSEKAIRQYIHLYEQYFTRQIYFNDGKSIEKLSVDEIYYVEANMKKIYIRKKEEECVLNHSLKEVEQLLSKYDFLKIHRSYIVNLKHFRKLTHNSMFLDNGIEVPISKYRYKDVKIQVMDYIERQKECDLGKYD